MHLTIIIKNNGFVSGFIRKNKKKISKQSDNEVYTDYVFVCLQVEIGPLAR